LAEYRLDDLARISGVSARNIRAYRERGLLDPPRRQGRSAYYDDYHLAQLETIKQLLRKGFNSAHIAEFFQSMREGADLADILGLQRVVLGRRRERPGDRSRPFGGETGTAVPGFDLDPASDEVRQLLDRGLAELVDGTVVLVDRVMGEIVSRSPDQLAYVRAILRIFDSTRQTIDELAAEVGKALEDCIVSRFGRNYLPKPEEMPELGQIVQDYRDLAAKVVADHLDGAMHHQMVTAVSDYTERPGKSSQRRHQRER
jgi:DNA-binding transcriptional MerR regulator